MNFVKIITKVNVSDNRDLIKKDLGIDYIIKAYSYSDSQ